MSGLLPCPFCEGEAAPLDENNHTSCTNIACGSTAYMHVDAWNSRPSSPNTGTFVPSDDENEASYRTGYADGERDSGENLKHCQEYAAGLEKTISELQARIVELRNDLYRHGQEAAGDWLTEREMAQ